MKFRNLALPALILAALAAPAVAQEAKQQIPTFDGVYEISEPVITNYVPSPHELSVAFAPQAFSPWLVQVDAHKNLWIAQCTSTQRVQGQALAKETPAQMIERACAFSEAEAKRAVPGFVLIPKHAVVKDPSHTGLINFRWFDHAFTPDKPMEQVFAPWLAQDPEHPGAYLAQCAAGVRSQVIPTKAIDALLTADSVLTSVCQGYDLIPADLGATHATLYAGYVFIPVAPSH